MTQTPSPANLPSEVQDPMSRHPLEHQFGLFVADSPGYGGVQGFNWFSTHEEAIQWLCSEAPDLYDGDDATLKTGLASLLSGHAILQELPLEQVNALAKGCFEVRWAGHFDDLMCGSKPFERDIQADFHNMVFPDERGFGEHGTMQEDYVVHLLNYHAH